MADQSAKISIDDIVAAAGSGALRAMSARGGTAGDKDLSIDRLVASGFGVRFELWAGGWPGPWGPGNLPGNLPGTKGGIG